MESLSAELEYKTLPSFTSMEAGAWGAWPDDAADEPFVNFLFPLTSIPPEGSDVEVELEVKAAAEISIEPWPLTSMDPADADCVSVEFWETLVEVISIEPKVWPLTSMDPPDADWVTSTDPDLGATVSSLEEEACATLAPGEGSQTLIVTVTIWIFSPDPEEVSDLLAVTAPRSMEVLEFEDVEGAETLIELPGSIEPPTEFPGVIEAPAVELPGVMDPL